MFRSTIRNAWRGTFHGGTSSKQASARAIDSQADLRWGADGKGWRRILAPNGICVLGTWEITEDNPYTGYFQKGSKGLTIGRFSSDGNETKRGQRRSISLGMKIYPTTDPKHPTPLIPASVIVQEDLGGMRTEFINDAELVNTPSVHGYRRGIYVLIMLRAGTIFLRLDKVADVRQLHEVAELGKPATCRRMPRSHDVEDGERPAPDRGRQLDFRDEIYAHMFKPGDAARPAPWTSTSSCRTTAARRAFRDCGASRSPTGSASAPCDSPRPSASYNGDHVIQFHHPGWRDDRNDPSTYDPGARASASR